MWWANRFSMVPKARSMPLRTCRKPKSNHQITPTGLINNNIYINYARSIADHAKPLTIKAMQVRKVNFEFYRSGDRERWIRINFGDYRVFDTCQIEVDQRFRT